MMLHTKLVYLHSDTLWAYLLDNGFYETGGQETNTHTHATRTSTNALTTETHRHTHANTHTHTHTMYIHSQIKDILQK